MSFEPPQAPGPPPGWGSDPLPGEQPGGYSAGPVPDQQGKTPGKATASLVLGIVGLLICPLVCSVLAIIFGQRAKREIAANPGLGGAGIAQAGFILGIVGLVFGILFAILVVAGGLSV